jgi:exodeoxyribonuclease VII large subunit
MDMEKEFIDLFEFQSRLKKGIELLFPNRLWIRAEVSAVKARNGGHCYLELSQSDGSGLIAKASAIIWSSKYRFIAPYFESVTGSPLQEGMVILVEVQPTYSQLYGFSLIINDIDPEYSLGLKELERQKTIERLQSEGLMDRQKGLALPALPYHLAVISAADAAGYRDFMRHLDENPYGFKVNPVLYPALMQGTDCPASIVAALDAILESGQQYDAVLIMRGGGSKLDLACFDDYEMAASIAQYPIPVLTGVGHDHDFHVCDMVAYEYVKTPTALADYILEMYENEDARLSSYHTRMRLALSSRVSAMENKAARLIDRVRNASAMKISLAEAALNVIQTRIAAADPRKIMERGYALAVDGEGVVLKSAAGVSAGDKVSVMFADGTIKAQVMDVSRHCEERSDVAIL